MSCYIHIMKLSLLVARDSESNEITYPSSYNSEEPEITNAPPLSPILILYLFFFNNHNFYNTVHTTFSIQRL